MNNAYGRRLFADVICHTNCSFWSIFSRTFSSSKAAHPCPKGCGHWSGTTTLFQTEGCSFSCFKSKRVGRGQGARGVLMAAWEWRRSYDMYVKCDIGIRFYIPCIYIYRCIILYIKYRKSSSRRSKQAERTTTSFHLSHLCWTWMDTGMVMKKVQGQYTYIFWTICGAWGTWIYCMV